VEVSGRASVDEPAVGQERIEVGWTDGEGAEHVGQVGQRGYPVLGAGPEEAVEGRGATGGVMGAGEEIVLPAMESSP
jgi:hypothetical protein